MTKDGFFSAVQDWDDNECVYVRARREADLENLNMTLTDEAPIIKTFDSDYRYRVHLPKSVWAQYVFDAAWDIDYSNFKSEIATHSRDHAKAYHGVWEVLYRLQTTENR